MVTDKIKPDELTNPEEWRVILREELQESEKRIIEAVGSRSFIRSLVNAVLSGLGQLMKELREAVKE